jgi:hypothetical protein
MNAKDMEEYEHLKLRLALAKLNLEAYGERFLLKESYPVQRNTNRTFASVQEVHLFLDGYDFFIARDNALAEIGININDV